MDAGATNCGGLVHDQASSPLRFLMTSAPPAEDGAESNMVVFVRLKGWFYEVQRSSRNEESCEDGTLVPQRYH
jgi:hypothetical protein